MILPRGIIHLSDVPVILRLLRRVIGIQLGELDIRGDRAVRLVEPNRHGEWLFLVADLLEPANCFISYQRCGVAVRFAYCLTVEHEIVRVLVAGYGVVLGDHPVVISMVARSRESRL